MSRLGASRTVACAAGAAGAGTLLALAFRATTEIVDVGRLLPDVDQRVYELRVLGTFTAHVAPQTRGADFVEVAAVDLFTGLVLVWIGGAAFLAAATLEAIGRERNARRWRFHLLLAAGAAWLALDELLSLHESIGFNLPNLEQPVDVHASTALLVAYLALAAALGWRYRDIVLRCRAATWTLAVAAVAFAAALVADVIDHGAEELIELGAAVALSAGIGLLAFDEVSSAARRAGPARS
jgi:hypothetical protein